MGATSTSPPPWPGVGGRPLLVAGPCSAESRDQMDEAARRLSVAHVDYLRAGIWKPRTRPGSFEGVGVEALEWLRAAGHAHGMRTATEVASAAHVDAALEHDIDLVWIGARTTASPFAVQEIANALRGTSLPVLVKNPISPDIALWLGAFERVERAGVKELGVVHRGFTTHNTSRFRNAPLWEIAIEFRRALPQVPMLCDPSHISGRRELVLEVAQRAMDLGLDGLMIEAHPSPEHAWSDAAQQVTPERLADIVAHLKVRAPTSGDPGFTARLDTLRDEIDHIDSELLDLLASRMRTVERIAALKKESNVTSLQVARWRAMLADRMKRGEGLGLSADYVHTLYEAIHAEAVRRQSELMNSDGEDGAPDRPN